MSRYRRADRPGATLFLTVVTHRRRPLFTDRSARQLLHDAIVATRTQRPFALVQSVLLPDHVHLILRLPADDADYSTRIASIKATFTRSWLAAGGDETVGTASRTRQRYRGVWQKRFWEHTVMDGDDLARCEAYVWFNPVKHGFSTCPHAWPWSTFHREVQAGRLDAGWRCVCAGQPSVPPAEVPGAEADDVAG